MGKEARARVLADNEAKAIGTMIRVSPRKLNLVAQSIRGKSAEAALNELTFSQKRVAGQVKKVLQSAIANAENNHDLDVDDLFVKDASVGKNMVLKRFHARARGRGARIEKPFAQVTIVVEEKREKEPAKKASPKGKPNGKGRAGAQRTENKKPPAKNAPAKENA
ncbi:MAG: 50S ribosomal protein L22 [Alphaproteobacteria bacterium]|nr:50S ribosomal protein L22 [Alphaproteobacteria bacterium]MBV9062528.1 50S ribosomal protein L22 [Alphaproteobacteria bacterium]